MILTVTPNPSLDRTYELPGLRRGAVLRASADRVDPGGKGVNVSRAVAAAGHRTVAVLPLGGPRGRAAGPAAAATAASRRPGCRSPARPASTSPSSNPTAP